jgi:signal transduction histidine kinase
MFNQYAVLAVKSREGLLRWRWALATLAAVMFITFEVGEHLAERPLYTAPSFVREVLLFGIVGPLVMGILLTFLTATRSERLQALDRLAVQRDLARQLATIRDWQELASFVTRFPQKLVPVSGVSLFVNDPQAIDFCLAADWWAAGDPGSSVPWLSTPGLCVACTQAQTASTVDLLSCQCPAPSSLADYGNRYSLPLVHSDQPVAILYLYFPAGFALTAEQIDLLRDTAAPLAMAIHSAQPTRSAALQTEAVKAERQRIARDLHDTLGQSIGFLHLKLDQLATDSALHEIVEIQQELERMRDVASEAYTQVRNTLSDLKPAKEQVLATAILQRAQSAGERAHFQVQVRSQGQPQALPPRVYRHVLYLFREALTNVEKHAHARRVEISLEWTAETLRLTLVDDGRGFDPDILVPNGHFGLEIMRERAHEVNGQLNIQSSPSAGTRISLSLPLDSATAPADKEGGT